MVQIGGPGNTATTADNTKAGQRNGSAATAPGAVAAISKKTDTPWHLYVLMVAAIVAGGEYLSTRLPAK
ncbi:MAG TPA: hypothetical protein VF690_21360 [Hymenobacter sp.]